MTTDPTFRMLIFAVEPLELTLTTPVLLGEYNFDALLSLTVPSVNPGSP